MLLYYAIMLLYYVILCYIMLSLSALSLLSLCSLSAHFEGKAWRGAWWRETWREEIGRIALVGSPRPSGARLLAPACELRQEAAERRKPSSLLDAELMPRTAAFSGRLYRGELDAQLRKCAEVAGCKDIPEVRQGLAVRRRVLALRWARGAL